MNIEQELKKAANIMNLSNREKDTLFKNYISLNITGILLERTKKAPKNMTFHITLYKQYKLGIQENNYMRIQFQKGKYTLQLTNHPNGFFY